MAKDHEMEAIHPPRRKTGDIPIECAVKSGEKRIEFDYEYYSQILASDDLRETEKLELLEVLWSIMREFAMLGFGVHPIQQACGKEGGMSERAPNQRSILLDSNPSNLITELEDADLCEDRRVEGVEA